MTFGSLCAVDKAYAERDNDESRKNTQKLTRLIRDMKEHGEQQVAYFKTKRINEAKEKKTEDKKRFELGKQKVNTILFSFYCRMFKDVPIFPIFDKSSTVNNANF